MKFAWPAGRKTAMKKTRKAYEAISSSNVEDDDFERRRAYDEWQVERAAYLRRVCFELEVPMPEIPYGKESSAHWEKSEYLGRWYLTPQGLAEVNLAIHEAKTRRFETVSRWVVLGLSIVGALTGVVGAAIGLVSVWP